VDADRLRAGGLVAPPAKPGWPAPRAHRVRLFLGTLAGSRIGAVAAFGAALLFLHRGPLCQAIIGYPGGRPLGRVGVLAVVVCYLYAAAVPLARSGVLTIGVALLVLAVTAWG